jgi:hypothetical protein
MPIYLLVASLLLPSGGDDFGDTPERAAPLPAGGLLRGRIDHEGDVDVFRLEARAGQTYVITVALETLDDSVVSVSDGERDLAEDDDGGAGRGSRLVWSCPRDGTYFVRVRAYADGTGAYRLDVVGHEDDHGDSPQTATRIEPAGARAGRIDFASDADLFAIRCRRGETYVFSVALRALPDSRLELRGRDGRKVLEENDDANGVLASEIVWTCPADGEYFLRVLGFAGSTGRYWLHAAVMR